MRRVLPVSEPVDGAGANLPTSKLGRQWPDHILAVKRDGQLLIKEPLGDFGLHREPFCFVRGAGSLIQQCLQLRMLGAKVEPVGGGVEETVPDQGFRGRRRIVVRMVLGSRPVHQGGPVGDIGQPLDYSLDPNDLPHGGYRLTHHITPRRPVGDDHVQIEPIGISGLGQQSLGLLYIVGNHQVVHTPFLYLGLVPVVDVPRFALAEG